MVKACLILDNNTDRGKGKWVGTKWKTHIISITMKIYDMYFSKFSKVTIKGMHVIIMWLKRMMHNMVAVQACQCINRLIEFYFLSISLFFKNSTQTCTEWTDDQWQLISTPMKNLKFKYSQLKKSFPLVRMTICCAHVCSPQTCNHFDMSWGHQYSLF